MTNKEKYLETLANIAIEHGIVALLNGMPMDCNSISCIDCDFCNDEENESCFYYKRQVHDWANAEYVEPQVDWTLIPIDTLILVRNNVDEDWIKRYFAGVENNKVYTWTNGTTSKSTPNIRIWESWKYATLIV